MATPRGRRSTSWHRTAASKAMRSQPSARPRSRPRSTAGWRGLPPCRPPDGGATMADAIDELFRRFGRAFNKADVEEIAACVTDEFEWRLNAGGAPAGRVLKGKEALRAHFADNST